MKMLKAAPRWEHRNMWERLQACRVQLVVFGFLSDKENEKVSNRLLKALHKQGLMVSEELVFDKSPGDKGAKPKRRLRPGKGKRPRQAPAQNAKGQPTRPPHSDDPKPKGRNRRKSKSG